MTDSQKNKAKKWSERETVRFVELYESEEVVWNIRLKDYKNKDARDSAIQRIINNFGMQGLTTADVLKKINNIRGTYTQEKAKEKKSIGTGSGVEDVYVSTLPWYDIAERFLSGVVKSRKTIEPDSHAAQGRANELASEGSVPPTSPDVPESVSPDVPTVIDSSSNSILNEDEIFSRIPSTINKKRKKNQTAPYIEKSIETLQSIKNQVLKNKEVEDEFTYFGKNVASQLRHLPIMDALDIQSEILDLLRRKRQLIHRIQEQNIPSPNMDETEYRIELPEHVFQEQSTSSQNITDETEYRIELPEHVLNSIQQSQLQLDNDINSRNTALEEAIRSIGGVTSSDV